VDAMQRTCYAPVTVSILALAEPLPCRSLNPQCHGHSPALLGFPHDSVQIESAWQRATHHPLLHHYSQHYVRTQLNSRRYELL